MLKLDCYFTTSVGKIRKNNEDNFYLNGNYKRAPEDTECEKGDFLYDSGLFAVCDGMGGEEFGEKASLFAVEVLKEYQNKDFNKYVTEYINTANERICQMIEENNGTRSGSTVALVYISNNKAISYNVGDSRVYLFRNGVLTQISEDHTRVGQMLKMGILTEKQAAEHRERHVLTQHFGIFPDELIIQAYKSQEIKVSHDDIILLCSDGLTDMLTDMEIAKVLKENASAKECANLLKELALVNGGKDNVTVGVIKAVNKKMRFFKRNWSRF